jgi:hypothetical protein
MNRELAKRIDRLEDHMSVGKHKKPIVLWAEPGEDQASTEARAKARGYVAGDRLYVLSWKGPRQRMVAEPEAGAAPY